LPQCATGEHSTDGKKNNSPGLFLLKTDYTVCYFAVTGVGDQNGDLNMALWTAEYSCDERWQ
jgi:hypothetical protein